MTRPRFCIGTGEPPVKVENEYRGQCPTCGGWICLTAKGKLRPHGVWETRTDNKRNGAVDDNRPDVP